MVDVVLALMVTGVLVLMISANYGGEIEADALAYLWAAGLGALMLVRRSYPVLVLALSVLGLFAYYVAGYPAVGISVPVAAALFSASEAGRLRWSVGAGLVVVGVSVSFRLAEGQAASLVVGYELSGHVLLMAAATALGDGLRSRRRAAADARRIVALTAQEERRRTADEARARRETVARELHDALGHRVTVISLHADVAREAVGRADDRAASAALRVITDTSSGMLSELRRTVRLLRGTETGLTAPGTGSGGLQATIGELEALTDSGPAIRWDLDVPPTLDARVESAAVAILREAVVNVLRHSTSTEICVSAEERQDLLEITVQDQDGSVHDARARAEAASVEGAESVEGAAPRRAAPPEGYGILGMRERAAAVGGVLDAGPGDGGFTVRALLPLTGRGAPTGEETSA